MEDKSTYWEYPEKITYKGPPPPSGEDWFFILTTARTGSTVLAKILNLHEQIYCGNEENILHLFSVIFKSKKIFYKKSQPRLRYDSQFFGELDLKGLRELMEAWRKTRSDANLFGDKDWLYGEEYSDLTDKVFPGHKKILTVRNILDQLSSLYDQNWHSGLPEDKDKRFLQILDDAKYRLSYNNRWRNEVDFVVKFEDLSEPERAKKVLYKILDTLEVDKKKFDVKKAISLCRHRRSIDRWKKDDLIIEFLNWLEMKDPELEMRLKQGYYY